MMKLLAIVVSILVAFVNPVALVTQSPHGQESSPAEPVSLIRLISTPSDFDGRRIRVAGYLGGAGLDKSLGLYVSGIDGRNGILMNAIAITRLEPTKAHELVGGYVLLSATFHAPAPHSGFNGYFDQVTDIMRWPTIEPK
jgi:hypothetical protein